MRCAYLLFTVHAVRFCSIKASIEARRCCPLIYQLGIGSTSENDIIAISTIFMYILYIYKRLLLCAI